jgi:uncharacterized protein YjbJ (UPF0337 family)
MNPSTKDEIKGTVHEVKGEVKETAGKVTNNPNLQAEGNAEKNTGKVEKKVASPTFSPLRSCRLIRNVIECAASRGERLCDKRPELKPSPRRFCFRAVSFTFPTCALSNSNTDNYSLVARSLPVFLFCPLSLGPTLP